MHSDEQMSEIPEGWWMKLTNQVADYMQNCFHEEVFKAPCVLLHISIPVLLFRHINIQPGPHCQEVIVNKVQCGKTVDVAGSQHYKEINTQTVVINENGNKAVVPSRCHQPCIPIILTPKDGAMTAYYSMKWPTLKGAWISNFHAEVSRLLKAWNAPNGVCRWVNEMSDLNALLSGVLSMIHLQMYATGQEALIRLNNIAKWQNDMDM
ncbi:hypothetical protein EDD15DRAFT_2197410 [Pisolithus albus]|nr:hypothetical protein EDD15DRAFT_2197410 [Pisolithus albus]